MNDDASPRWHGGNQVIANGNDAGIIDHADADNAAFRAQFGNARGGPGSLLDKGHHDFGPARPYGQRQAGIDDAFRHRATLATQADKTDPAHPAVIPASIWMQAP